MNTIEVNEDEYLALIEKNKQLQQKVDRYELFFYGVLKQADKIIKDEQDAANQN